LIPEGARTFVHTVPRGEVVMTERYRIVGFIIGAIVIALLTACYLGSARDWPSAIQFALLSGIAALVPFVTIIFLQSERAALILSPVHVSIGTLLLCIASPKAMSLFPQVAGTFIIFTSPFWMLGTLLAGKLLSKSGKTNKGGHRV